MAVTTTPKEATPAERLARARRAQALADGKVQIPLACSHCFGTFLQSVQGSSDCLCVSCGRQTSDKKAHTIRRQRIARYLRTGDL